MLVWSNAMNKTRKNIRRLREYDMRSTIVATLLILGIIASPSLARDVAPWEQKINAQIQFQKDLAGLLLNKAPEFQEIIILARELQITMYEMRRQHYLFLITRHPGRIDPDKDLNFEWTAADEDNLTKSNRDYAILKVRKKELQARSQGHPMWKPAREVFKEVRKTEEFRRIYNRLMAIINS